MVLGILSAIVACPAIIGTTEAVRQGQRQNAREEHRGRKSNLTVTLLARNSYSAQFNGAKVVLQDNKLWVDTRQSSRGAAELHPFTGYFLPYPSMEQFWRDRGFAKGEGMVTTINDDNYLNWVYVDHATHEVKHGNREMAEPHGVGPWDCTQVDRRLTFEGWEGFVAVQEEDGSDLWALYFDIDDDGLRSDGRIGTQDKRMLALVISRTELFKDRITSFKERVERLRDREEEKAERDADVSTIASTNGSADVKTDASANGSADVGTDASADVKTDAKADANSDEGADDGMEF